MKKITYAFFDVDETIVSFKTMFSFLAFYMGYVCGVEGKNNFDEYMKNVERDWSIDRSREEINKEYYRNFKDKSYRQLNEAIALWLSLKKKEMGDDFFISKSLNILRELQSKNVEIVFVSGSLTELVKPIADELDVKHILATRMVMDGDIINGEIIPPQTIGKGKAIAVKEFMIKNGVDFSTTIAYGDHTSDFPMLSAVDHGVIISNNTLIQQKAIEQGFEVIRL